MSRPSDTLLRWLRQQIDAQGQTTASLAGKLSRPRAEVRRLLTGKEPMLVDDLVEITSALELSPEAFGMPEAAVLDEEIEGPEPDQFGNQVEAIFRLAFDQGIDIMFLVAADELGDWGGPDEQRRRYRGKDLPLQLDAAYHPYMDIAYEDDAVEISLSFDKIYRCRFPWSAIRRVILTPLAPEPEPAAEPEDKPTKAPFLRLVE